MPYLAPIPPKPTTFINTVTSGDLQVSAIGANVFYFYKNGSDIFPRDYTVFFIKGHRTNKFRHQHFLGFYGSIEQPTPNVPYYTLMGNFTDGMEWKFSLNATKDGEYVKKNPCSSL